MRIGNAGKAGVVTAVLSLLLAVGDYTERSVAAAEFFGLPTRVLPLIYIVGFGLALILLRLEYESADYDFVLDPKTEWLSEQPVGEDAEHEYWYSETHRVSVQNYGHRSINASVCVRSITPEPPGLAAKLGMPLIAMGEPPVTVRQINAKDRAAFNLVSYYVDPSRFNPDTDDVDESLTLWHDWKAAPRDLPCDGAIVFELVLTAAEGPIKTATYELSPQRSGGKWPARAYRLTRVPQPRLWDRITRWWESPITSSPSRATTPDSSRVHPRS